MRASIIFCIILFQSNILFAQTLTVTGNNIANPQGNDPCMQTHTSTITVKNVSSMPLNILCEKVVIVDTVAGSANFFCWGGNCYPATTFVSTDYTTLNAGEESTATDFGGYFDAFCEPGVSVVQYNFYPDNNPTDITSITITSVSYTHLTLPTKA